MTRAIDDQPDSSFRYFCNDCRWSYRLFIGLDKAPWGGAEIRKIYDTGLRLQSRVRERAWFCESAAEAEHLENSETALLKNARRTGAAEFLFRAANYCHVSERFLHPNRTAQGVVAAASSSVRRPNAWSPFISGGCHAQ
jgi:hypothetical protein